MPKEEKGLETQEESRPTTEGAPPGPRLSHALPTITSFDSYNDLGREELLSPFYCAGG